MDIAAWLRSLGLEQYEPAFHENAVDAGLLPRLTSEDLKDIGVISVGHRRRMLDAIAVLQSEAAGARQASTVDHVPATTTAAPGAERRQLTIMFVDLVGSSALSSRLDPEQMREVIRAYQNAVSGEITRFEGRVAKYMGDGVLAYFGYPKAHEDDAERAVLAGLSAIPTTNGLCTPDGEALAVRVGIATGLVVIGELIGEGAAREEAVVGETPNLAARLQTVASPDELLIGPMTRRLVGGAFELEELGPQALKGFALPVPVWRVSGIRSVESRFEARASELTPMVGREQEVALLLERWQQAKDREGQAVLLSGEPGIGKSRIAQAVVEQVEADPHIRLRFQCSPHYTTTAFHPFVEHFERAAGFARDDTPSTKLDKLEVVLAQGTERVSEVAPLLTAMLAIPTDERYPRLAYTPQRQRELTIEALVEQLLGLARQKPVLCIFEDLHWADPTTLEVLGPTIDRIGQRAGAAPADLPAGVRAALERAAAHHGLLADPFGAASERRAG